jgi:hypothetical protein
VDDAIECHCRPEEPGFFATREEPSFEERDLGATTA